MKKKDVKRIVILIGCIIPNYKSRIEYAIKWDKM